MKLVKHTLLNRHFGPGSAPSKAQWREMILTQTIAGKIMRNVVYIDEDAFLHTAVFQEPVTSISALDLLIKSA